MCMYIYMPKIYQKWVVLKYLTFKKEKKNILKLEKVLDARLWQCATNYRKENKQQHRWIQSDERVETVQEVRALSGQAWVSHRTLLIASMAVVYSCACVCEGFGKVVIGSSQHRLLQ